MNEIYINLKSKYPYGIVEDEDKWQLESEIIAKLYEQRDEDGCPRIALALRNKDAAIIGLGGPECGDIIVMHAEQNLFDHGDGLPTALGLNHTTQNPFFAAAGKGIKKGIKTDRVIREVDVAPTAAWLAGVRMPAQCEGAPIYQIFEEGYTL